MYLSTYVDIWHTMTEKQVKCSIAGCSLILFQGALICY